MGHLSQHLHTIIGSVTYNQQQKPCYWLTHYTTEKEGHKKKKKKEKLFASFPLQQSGNLNL